jgi:bifunctional DNase/RNase
METLRAVQHHVVGVKPGASRSALASCNFWSPARVNLRGLTVWKGIEVKSLRRRSSGAVYAAYESSSGGSNHVEGGGNGTSEYVETQVMDAVSMVPFHGKLLMTLGNGKEMEVDHINPAKGRLLYKSSTPTIFLKVTDGSNLMLPIVVGEAAVSMLMRALHDDEHAGRPNYYVLMRDMVESLHYEPRMVRITDRVVDTYYARIYVGKPGEEELVSVDARPSDAINLAVRCKIPIYVNSSIIKADAVRPVTEVELTRRVELSMPRKRSPFLGESYSSYEPDVFQDEMAMVVQMLVAAQQERYADACRWRDELARLRADFKGKMRRL